MNGLERGLGRVWLGTATFGSWGNADHGACIALVRRALDEGIRAIDTADSYSNGEAEIIVGEALASTRERVFVATKVGYPGSAVGEPMTSTDVVRAADASLRRLGIDRIDLYQIHRLRSEDALDELLAGLDRLVVAGKIGAVGTSMFRPSALVRARAAAARLGGAVPVTEQAPYSLLVREIENEVTATCDRLGIGLLGFAPLNGGWLTGKYEGGAVPAGSRAADWPVRRERYDFSRPELVAKMAAVDALGRLAASLGMSLAQLALAFSLSNPHLSAVIVGFRTTEQFDELLPVPSEPLPAATLADIDAIVAPGATLDPADISPYRLN